MPEAFITNCDR